MCYFCHTLGRNSKAPEHSGENCCDPRNAKSKRQHGVKVCYHCFRKGDYGLNNCAKLHHTKECKCHGNTYSKWCHYCNKMTNRHNTATHRNPSSSTASGGRGSAQGGGGSAEGGGGDCVLIDYLLGIA